MTKQGSCFERPNFIMANQNQNIVWWMPIQKTEELVFGAGASR